MSGGGGEEMVDGGGSGDSDGEGGGGLNDVSTPVSRMGATTLPVLPLVSKATVSAIGTVALPLKKVKPIVSPELSAYIVIWKIALPAYGPNDGMDGVSCEPRTVVPTKAVSVPDACSTPLSMTRADRAAVASYMLKSGGGRLGGSDGEGTGGSGDGEGTGGSGDGGLGGSVGGAVSARGGDGDGGGGLGGSVGCAVSTRGGGGGGGIGGSVGGGGGGLGGSAGDGDDGASGAGMVTLETSLLTVGTISKIIPSEFSWAIARPWLLSASDKVDATRSFEVAFAVGILTSIATLALATVTDTRDAFTSAILAKMLATFARLDSSKSSTLPAAVKDTKLAKRGSIRSPGDRGGRGCGEWKDGGETGKSCCGITPPPLDKCLFANTIEVDASNTTVRIERLFCFFTIDIDIVYLFICLFV